MKKQFEKKFCQKETLEKKIGRKKFPGKNFWKGNFGKNFLKTFLNLRYLFCCFGGEKGNNIQD